MQGRKERLAASGTRCKAAGNTVRKAVRKKVKGKVKKESCRKKRIVKALFCGLIMAAMLVCLSGCRDRITSRDDADKEIADKTGTMAADYEKRRKDLDLGTAADPVMQNKKEEPQEEKQKEEQKGEEESKDSNNKNSKTGSSENGGNKGSKEGGGNGNGNGKGNGHGSGKGQRKNRSEGEKENNNEEPAAKKVTVSFDANGGNCIPANETSRKYDAGSEYGTLPQAERNGHTFAGWFTDKEAGSIVNVNTIVPGRNHKLYAHWIARESEKEDEKVYTVTFDPNGGRLSAKKRTIKVTVDQPYGSLPTPINDGYEFNGWYTAKNGGNNIKDDSIFKGKKDQTLYAHWQYDPYTYWSYKLNNIIEKMYACQIVDCYIEFEDHVTASSCELLSGCNAGNAARNRGSDTTVTDEWVESRNPDIIIKCKGTSSNAASLKTAMARRFPDRRILVVPSAAVSGNKNEQLFYKLALGKSIYPKWYEEADLDKAAKELEVVGSVYE